MILPMLRVLALGLWRDRAGLVLTFLLPPIVFVVFAAVFSSGVQGRLAVKAGLVDRSGSPEARALTADLSRTLNGRLIRYPDAPSLTEAVLSGAVDAGVVLGGDLVQAASPALILYQPARRAAGAVVAAEVEAAARTRFTAAWTRRDLQRLTPILALRPDQAARLARLSTPGAPTPFARIQLVGSGDAVVIYYAAAVSILFLMFTAAQGSFGMIEERSQGLRLRLGLSAHGLTPLILGRAVWLTGLGLLQGLFVFTTAALVYDAPLSRHLIAFAVTATLAAAASAGVGLTIGAACASREQAHTVSTFVILVLAAVGGSMAPRFLMPPLLQALGWATPHAWVIDAYQTILWREAVTGETLRAWLVLALMAAAGVASARLLEGRRRR